MKLNKKEIEAFKQSLTELRLQITHSLQGAKNDVKISDDSAAYSQHQADVGTDDFDKTVNLELTSKEFEILRQIDRALEKIEDDTYGICDLTGQSIPKRRLEAIPYATMTVEAQERREKGVI